MTAGYQFIAALVGHVTGDFLLQNRWMSASKPASRLPEARLNWWGFSLHILIAGGLPAVFAGWWSWKLAAAILSHAAIDGFRLGRWWVLFYRHDAVDSLKINGFITDQAFHWLALWVIAVL